MVLFPSQNKNNAFLLPFTATAMTASCPFVSVPFTLFVTLFYCFEHLKLSEKMQNLNSERGRYNFEYN